MNSNILWSDQVPQKDGIKSSINDIAISPGKFLNNCAAFQLKLCSVQMVSK